MTATRFPEPRNYNRVYGIESARTVNGTAPKAATSKPSKAAMDRFGEVNHFNDVTGKDCSMAAQLVWFRMWRHASGRECRVSRQRIANEAGVSLNTVKRALRELTEKGFIILKTRGNSSGRTNVYELRARPQT